MVELEFKVGRGVFVSQENWDGVTSDVTILARLIKTTQRKTFFFFKNPKYYRNLDF